MESLWINNSHGKCKGKYDRVFQRIKAYKRHPTSGNFRSSTARFSKDWSIIRVCWTRWRKPVTRQAWKVCYPSWNGGSSRTRKLSDNGQLWGNPLRAVGTRRIHRWPPHCCSSPRVANLPSNWWARTAHRYTTLILFVDSIVCYFITRIKSESIYRWTSAKDYFL